MDDIYASTTLSGGVQTLGVTLLACQLKLSSPAGIDRGASKEMVYNGERFKTMAPTRLYIDAKTTKEWRDKGFYTAPVRAPEATVKPERRITNVEIARCTTASTAVRAWGSAASRKRREMGKVPCVS